MPYKCPIEQKEYHRNYYNARKPAFLVRNRKNKYGITPDDYEKMLEEQEFSCGICRTHISNLPKPLYIDHCHDTDRVRGLLCLTCNAGLGMLGDDEDGLETALRYLRSN